MQITRTKKALIAVIALVLVGIFVAVAAVYLPGAENTLPTKDNTVADTGSGADTVSTVSASATAPLEDGTVPEGYQPSGTGISDIATARGNLDGEYYLTQDITITSLAVANNSDEENIFTGVFDGNGKTITINATESSYTDGNFGGLFAILQGTVKNCIIVVEDFQIRLGSGSSWANAGMVAGAGGEGAYVENVKVVLKYSPDTVGNGSSDFYINQYGGQSAKGSSMRLGGVFGNIIGAVTVVDSTVDNQTTGNYGLSTYGWRASGGLTSHSDGFSFIGGFFGRIQSGSISASRIALAGSSSSKMYAYNESTSSYRYNQCFIGGILGYADEGSMSINGLIITYQMNDNFGYTNGNYSCGCGIINGYADNGYAGSVQNAYILSGVESAYSQSNGAGLTVNYNTFASGITPVFVGTSDIAFNGFTKQAPANASSIVATITQGGTTQNVMEALIATSESEAGQSVWLTVPTVNATSTAAINLAASYATGSTITLSSDLTFSSGEGIYMASREYNGENVTASIVLGDGKTDLYYSEANANKNVGTHTLTSNIASASEYSYIEYAGVKYVYNTSYTTIYVPQEVAGAPFDVTNTLSVEITQREITVGNNSGNVTYGDTLDVVQSNNIPVATNGSFVAGEYVESCTIEGYVQFALNAGEQVTFSYTGVVIKDEDGNDVTANYAITFAEGKAVVKQKTVAGSLSVEDLVYSNTEKTAVFTATEGMGLFNEDAVQITYSGDQVNVTSEGFTATATLPTYDGANSNYTFGGENGASISQTFVINPYSVTITAKDLSEANTVDFTGGIVPNEVLADLFNIPDGLGGEQLFLNFAVTLNGEEATAYYAGEYTITATLADQYQNEEGETVSQTNYVAESCDTTLTIKAKDINVSLSDVENSKTYDGVAVGDDYLQTMFVVDGTVAEGHVAELVITVAEGEIKNAGVYNISVALPSDYDKMYAISSTSVTETTYTVEQVVIDGEIVAPEDSVYDGSEKFATFEFAEGSEMVGNDEIILSYATQEGQVVAQVLSAGTYTVSAALPTFNSDGDSNYVWANESIATKNIVISKAPVTITANSATAEKTFDGAAFTDYASLFTAPSGVNNEGSLALAYSVTMGEEAISDGIVNAGVYTVTATLADNGANANYEAEAAVVTYTVNAKTIAITWSENNYTYNGSVQTVTAKYTDIEGTEVDLSVSFGEGVEFKNAGEYIATASFANGETNYALPENATNTYNIGKADSVINTEGVETVYTYTGEVQTVTGATLNHEEAELVYQNNTFTTVAEGNGMEVTISVSDTANYNGTSTTVKITVNKATPAVTASVEIPEGGLFTSSEFPSISTDCAVEGVITWDEGQTLTAGGNSYVWTFTPVDTDNYNVVTGSETLTVSEVELTGIEVKTQPSKVEYQYGDKFDKTGMVVEAVYNDGSRVVVEEYTVSDDYLTTLGENQITVTYNEKTATVIVKVEAKVFELAYNDLTVVAGTDDFDIAGITASIVGAEGNKVTVAGTEYEYTVAIAYTSDKYNSSAEVGIEYPLTVTVNVTDLDGTYYQSAYTATLRVIATPMEGSWASDNVTAEYDGNAHAVEFTMTTGGEYEIQYSVKGTDVWTTEAPVNAGEYVAKVVSKDSGYSADRIPTASIVINKKTVTISGSDIENGNYNGESVDPATLFTAPSGVDDEGPLALAYTITKDGSPVDEIKNAGTYKVVATLANADGNYAAESCEVTYIVSPVEVAVPEAVSGLKYDGSEQTGVADGEYYTVSGGTATNAGTHTATVTLTDKNNYVWASGDDDADGVITVEWSIAKADYDMSDAKWNYSEAFVYNGSSFTVEVTGLPAGVTVEKYENNTATVVGGYTASVTLSYDAVNYEAPSISNLEWNIVNADMTDVSVNGYSGEYDKTAHGAVVSASAVTVDGSEVTFTYATSEDGDYGDAPEYTDAGVYTVYYKAYAANHNEVSGSFTVTITKAANEWIVTPSIEGWTYGETASTPAGEAKFGEVTLAYQTASGDMLEEKPVNAGSYKLVVTVAATENYEGLSETVDFTIAKADYDMSGVTFEDKTVTYNGNAHSITVSGALPDGVTVIYAGEGTDAGEYTVTATFAIGNENYNVPEAMTATLTVAPKELTFTGYRAVGREYTGDKTITLTGGSLSGIIDGDSVTYSYRGEMNTANAGVNTVTVYIELTGKDAGNYTVAQPATTTVTITPATLTVVWSETEFEYNGETQAPTATVTGTVYGESVTLNVTGGAVNAGTYTAKAAMATENGNYTLDNDTVEFTINKLTVEKPVANGGFVYDGGEKTVVDEGEYYTVTDGAAVNAGDYTATVALKDTVNTVWADGTTDSYTVDWSIAKATLTVENVEAPNKVYDGGVSVTVTGTLSGVYGDDDVTLVIGGTTADKNVGENKTVTVTASISGVDSGNYTLADVENTTVTVTVKELTVVWGALTFEYDGEAKLPTATVETGIDGENVTLAVSADGEAVQPGTYNATAAISPADGNYTLANATVEFTITRSEIVAQFTVESYGEIMVIVEGDENVEYSVDGGEWTALPADGKITVTPAASWTVRLRFAGETTFVSHVVYTSADNVVTYLENNLSDNALDNVEVIDTAKAWLETAVGDKSEATAKIEAAEQAYEAAKAELSESVENAFKATANMTSRTVAVTVAIATAVSGLGLAVGAIALRRKGGKKNEK